MQEIYHYDIHGFYTTSSFARENPISPGEYLYPARSTNDPPPTVGANQIPRWTAGAWAVDVDYRGKWYDVDTQAEIHVWDAGEPQPTNTTSVPPPANEPTWVYTGTAWERTLDVAKQEKTQQILDAFDIAKEATYNYNGHDYSIKDLFVLLLLTGVELNDGAGMVMVYDVDHNVLALTKPDAQTLVEGVYAASLSLTINRETKLKAINDAADIPTVDAISW